MPEQKLHIVTRTDVGRKRSNNEDCLGSEPALGMVVLADGMGGARGGEFASALAVDTVLSDLRDKLPALGDGGATAELQPGPRARLARVAIQQANRRIHEAATRQPQYRGMGTTVVVALFEPERVSIAHVGDSRLYRYRDGRLHQLTHDHTLVQEYVDRGIDRATALEQANGNLVTRALGVEATVEVDVQERPTQPDEVYLLCSDGLTDLVDDGEIAALLGAYVDDLDAAAGALIDTANERGGKDNVSVILVRVPGAQQGRGWLRRMLRG
ncbi:MAG TPA: PP2C family serine/threonine-protein phosphatase [Gammaproteobacteria bacterium]